MCKMRCVTNSCKCIQFCFFGIVNITVMFLFLKSLLSLYQNSVSHKYLLQQIQHSFFVTNTKSKEPEAKRKDLILVTFVDKV